MAFDLAFIWAGLIAFAVLAYVLFDGFDLGIGILFPFLASDAGPRPGDELRGAGVGRQRDLAGARRRRADGGLSARLRRSCMPALYAPIIAMLLGLVFRGVAFEFRWRTVRGKPLWDWAFAGGSPLPPSRRASRSARWCRASRSADRAYAGGWWDWLTPFSLLTGVALVVGYALLGATWLIMKTSGELQAARAALRLDRRRSARWR